MNGSAVPSPAAPSQALLPMTFGQALDRVFKLVKANLRLLLSIASVPAVVNSVLVVMMVAAMFSVVNPLHPSHPPHVGALLPLFLAMAVAELLVMLVYALYEPAASYAALQADAGVRVTCGQAYQLAWRKAGRYLWLMILRFLVVSGPVIVLAAIVGIAAAVVLGTSKGHADPSIVFALIPLVIAFELGFAIYAVFALIWMAFCYPACVQENLTAAASIGRSFRLTRGARGRIFLLALVIYAIVYAASLVLECILAALAGLAMIVGMVLRLAMNPWGYIGIGLGVLVLMCAMFFVAACSMAGYSAAFAVLYRDQRRSKDGVAPLFAPRPELETP